MTLARLVINRRRELLSLLPDSAYQVLMSRVPGTRQPIWIVNHPKTVLQILGPDQHLFAKADLMVQSLRPLTGNGVLISEGEEWKQQHRLMASAFNRARLPDTTAHITDALEDLVRVLARCPVGAEISLDALAHRVSATALYRMLFAASDNTDAGRALVEALDAYGKATAKFNPAQILSGTGSSVAPDKATRAAAARLREVLGWHVAHPVSSGRSGILASLMASRDKDTGARFSADDLVDQLASFLVAGHETMASLLTWALFLLARQPECAARIAAEARSVSGTGPVTGEHAEQMPATLAILREVLRLYPPMPFLMRTALAPMQIRSFDLAAGDLVILSPWLIHRHDQFWDDPEMFDPDRFAEGTDRLPSAFLPFGRGPRACIGAALAQIEGVMALATLCRAFRFEIIDPGSVMPVCRMTLEPEKSIGARLFPAG